MPAKVLVVAWDSAEPELVRRWAAQGLLPNLSRLLDTGHALDIANLPGFGNGVFWPSIYTGLDPSHHGGYYLCQPKPPNHAVELFTKYDYPVPPFWKNLEDDGCDVGVIDPIESPCGRLTRGVEILDWNVHRRESAPCSTPPDLMPRILEQYGENPFGGNVDRMVKEDLPPEALSGLSERRIERKTEAALAILSERDWDFFMVCYADPHDIGHAAWHLHDREPSDASPGGDPLQACYRQLDAALGRLLRQREPDGQALVVMGPGMQRKITGRELLPEILLAFQGRGRRGIRKVLSRASRAIITSRWIPFALRSRFRTQRERIGSQAKARSGLRFFTVPHNEDASAVRISVEGREQHGVVAPGDYDAVCDELSQRLLALRDASGQQSAVSEVIKVHARYSGPELGRLPDLLVVWNRSADLSAIRSSEHGVFRKTSASYRSGDHTRRGLLLAERVLPNAPAQPLSPMQVTPLLLDAVARHRGLPGARTAG